MATPTSLTVPNAHDPQPSELARVESLSIAFVPFHWNTPWGAPNASEADPLWDNINTSERVPRKGDSVDQRAVVNSFNSGLPLWTYLESLAKECIFSKLTISFTASYVTSLNQYCCPPDLYTFLTTTM
jgi:hypothetical protein